MEQDKIDVARLCRRVKMQYGWNQTQLAEAIGIKQPQVSKIERGKTSGKSMAFKLLYLMLNVRDGEEDV